MITVPLASRVYNMVEAFQAGMIAIFFIVLFHVGTTASLLLRRDSRRLSISAFL